MYGDMTIRLISTGAHGFPPPVPKRHPTLRHLQLSRGRHWLTLAICLRLLSGCSGRPAPTYWPGHSTDDPNSTPKDDGTGAAGDSRLRPEAKGTDTPHREQWIDPGKLARLVSATDQPYECQGHEPPNYMIHVSVSPESVQAYRALQPGMSMPEGTWVVARHSRQLAGGPKTGNTGTRTGTTGSGDCPIYFMHRNARGWSYGAASMDGGIIPVVEGVCQDCHSQGRADCLFGPPERSRRANAVPPQAAR
jgi:hypothetical protein